MSNKISLATIQFRADAKGVNPALDSIRQASKDAHDEVDRLQAALDRGVKTMKDANGVDFDVEKKIARLTKEAKSFDAAIRELTKGATALEAVWKNIELGTIEKNSRAELKGAINAAQSRLRSIRAMQEDGTVDEESLQRQRELNVLITEAQKQLNNLDRDTAKFIETLEKGEAVSQSMIDKEMKGLKEMLSLIPYGTEEWNKYNDQLVKIQQHVAAIRKQEREAATALLSSKDMGQYTEEQIRAAIASGKELLATYKTNSTEAKTLAENIVRAEQFLKQYGIEAARQAQREQEQLRLEKELAATMNKRLRDLKNLSADALAETRKYWEEQRNGAASGTKEFNKAEAALKQIDNLQKRRHVKELDTILGDPSKFGVAEVKNAVQEMEKLRDSVQKGIPVWQHYNKMVNEGKAYLDQLAKSEAAQRINDQMVRLTTLSNAGLQEVKKYWETMVAGAERGSEELSDYEAKLKQVMAEEQSRKEDSLFSDARKVFFSNRSTMSEAELRRAVEAAKEYQQTLMASGSLHKDYSRAIAETEEYLKQYGVEAERAARKEAKAIQEMQDQLAQGTSLTESALKAQASYWQRMIDDPKNAGRNLQQYRDNLEEVKHLQGEMIKDRGRNAFDFFKNGEYENASADEIQRQAKALKAYRDSLPQKDNVDEIAQMDAYLQKTGQSAKKAAEQAMSLRQAVTIGRQVIGGTFKGSADDLTKAKKVLEDLQQRVVKNGRSWQKLQRDIDAINIEIKRVGTVSKEVQDVLDQPKGRSFNQLKQAVEQGRLKLQAMDRTTKEGQKAFDELAKKIKACDLEMKTLGNSAKGTVSAFDKAWSRLKTYVGLYVGAAVAMQKVTATMGDLMELSDKMGEVRKTTDLSAEAVGHLTTELKKMDTRRSLIDLMDLASMAGSIGLKSTEEIKGFTEAANMLTVALPEMGNEAARTLMKIATATGDLEKNGGDVRETLERVGSTIIALRANSAAAAGPITDFVSRVGAVGAQAGISIDQIAALGATVDALGGRVEMSATALSRMIPAIKNNTFAVAQALQIPESNLKGKSGMEQMVAIFRKLHDSVKDFDMTTEDGMNGAAAAVEKMMGRSVSMQEVMKALNQQGARAGIVFGLLSQNVDMLEKQLNTASKAYEKNEALLKEYNNMNETAAAKWERLKNQLEEFFVGADATSWLSDIIDVLRGLADWVTDEGPLGRLTRYTILYLGLMKTGWTQTIGGAVLAVHEYMFATNKATVATVADTAATTADTGAKIANTAATEGAAAAQGTLNKAMKANIITAVLTVLTMLGWALYDYAQKAKEAARRTDILDDVAKKVKKDTIEQRAELEKLYKATQDQTKSIDERKEALRKMVGDAKYKEYYEKLNTESELAKAASEAYKDLATQIMATARARALDAKAEELQKRRLTLEDEKKEREDWRKENQSQYDRERAKSEAAVGQENRSETAGANGVGSKMGYVHARNKADMQVISGYQANEQRIERIDKEIGQIDEDIARLEAQINTGKKIGDDGGGGGGGGTNPYGDYNKVTDEYSKWSGNDLVARRKEMLERVKALANGADVQSVLSEDAKFISEAVRKNIKTTEQAIEWYNQERLKIQDALHAKHLTNTGDWLDPENVRKRVGRVVQDEMKYYMDELDAYYTERNQEIQRKRNEEEIAEGEAWLQTIRNETEWYQRRAELQKLYADKSKEVTQEEQDAIFNIIRERTGETTSFIKADIGKTVKLIEAVGEKSKEAMRRIIGDINLGVEKDALKSAKSVGKSVKFMADTLAKERPLNGIVDDLQTTLTKMGILEGQVPEKMRLLIGEIENAYSTDVKGLVDRISAAGFTEWAKQIEGDTTVQQALIAQLRKAYEAVQDAIRKEASRIKKDADMMWKTILLPDGSNLKQTTDEVLARMTQQQDSVGRANSLIGAGVASDNVATKLAIKQLQLQMSIQRAQFALMRKMGNEKAQYLEQLAKELELAGKLTDAERARKDAANVRKSLELAVTEETKKQQELSNQIAKEQEEAQNRLYTELKEWGDLLASSLQSIFEASAAGNEEYYNELAKLNLTGKGGPGAGTYVVIDDAGTEDATAHYEYLDERQALERQHEIEQENAKAEAWKKVMDELNEKMNDSITDWMNSFLQSEAIDNNTAALNTLTGAVNGLAGAMTMQGMSNAIQQSAEGGNGTNPTIERIGYEETATPVTTTTTEEGGMSMFLPGQEGGFAPQWEMQAEAAEASAERQVAAIDKVKVALDSQFQKQQQGTQDVNKKMTSSTQSAFAKMTAAANLYGIAYQAMCNDNLSAEEKFTMIAVQAAGQAAISMLTSDLAAGQAKNAVQLPGILGKLLGEMPYPAAIATFAIVTGLLGGLMGLAVSQVTKSKSQIAQATGSSGASAGRLTTGMLTYAEGNVNEFTNPDTLTPGRQYNVDAADGKTYRARYMGSNPRTHITNGPEFHLAGEAGREMIIDAGTTRQITMNEGEIWHAIQTLSNGGYSRRRNVGHGGMRAFKDGNVDDFDFTTEGAEGTDGTGMNGMTADQLLAFQASLDRNSAIMERLAEEGIEAFVSPYGKRGIVNGYDHYKKEAQRQGVKY